MPDSNLNWWSVVLVGRGKPIDSIRNRNQNSWYPLAALDFVLEVFKGSCPVTFCFVAAWRLVGVCNCAR